MEIIKVHIKKRSEKMCNKCDNYELCSVYGGTCKKREFVKFLCELHKIIRRNQDK